MDRKPDQTYNEKLLSSNIENTVVNYVTKDTKDKINNCKPIETDDYDTLLSKELIMKEDIFPLIENFNILTSYYNEVYELIQSHIEVFSKSIKQVNELTLREKRCKFYSSSS